MQGYPGWGERAPEKSENSESGFRCQPGDATVDEPARPRAHRPAGARLRGTTPCGCPWQPQDPLNGLEPGSPDSGTPDKIERRLVVSWLPMLFSVPAGAADRPKDMCPAKRGGAATAPELSSAVRRTFPAILFLVRPQGLDLGTRGPAAASSCRQNRRPGVPGPLWRQPI